MWENIFNNLLKISAFSHFQFMHRRLKINISMQLDKSGLINLPFIFFTESWIKRTFLIKRISLYIICNFLSCTVTVVRLTVLWDPELPNQSHDTSQGTTWWMCSQWSIFMLPAVLSDNKQEPFNVISFCSAAVVCEVSHVFLQFDQLSNFLQFDLALAGPE